jgi:hypothetical protein
MLRQNLHCAIMPAALAGILASTLALSAGPEHPRASAALVPIRQSLLAQCMAGSDEIGLRATPASRQERPGPARYTVCYAAILPARDAAGADD